MEKTSVSDANSEGPSTASNPARRLSPASAANPANRPASPASSSGTASCSSASSRPSTANSGSAASKQRTRRLHRGEHFVLHNVPARLPHYAALWVAGIALSYIACVLFGADSADSNVTMSFARAVFALFTLTVTLAVPTCLRSIFAAYEQYYSTTIKRLLAERFPITLLMLCAFTAIAVGVLYLSGITSVYLPVPSTFSLTMLLFWTVVCAAYIFVAIEKLVHFVVNAPGAVLDNLEASIYELENMQQAGDYEKFKERISSVNDIAATIIQKSTGRDLVVSRSLHAMRQIHATFLGNALKGDDRTKTTASFKACRVIRRETVRLFREAAAAKNERICLDVIGTWCDMAADAVAADANWTYITEMFSLLEKIQSHAVSSEVDEIGGIACVDWAPMLMRDLAALVNASAGTLDYAKTCIARGLAISLRRATLAEEEEVMLRFCRVASDSEIDEPLEGLGKKWTVILDRAVLGYLSWAFSEGEGDMRRWTKYLVNYSVSFTGRTRRVLTDGMERFVAMCAFEDMTDRMYAEYEKIGARANQNLKAIDGEAIPSGLSQDMNLGKALAYIVEASWCDKDILQMASECQKLSFALHVCAKSDPQSEEIARATCAMQRSVNIAELMAALP